jgi:Sulfotransferase domain
MKVNTFIVGVQKAGTTSLYEWLIQHEAICGEIFLKDYPFFNNSDLYEQGTELLEDKFNYNNEPVVISGCVDYIENSIGLERIKNYNPQSKIILILRNPEDRIYSAFKFLRQLSKETHDDINDAIKNDPSYLNRSLYANKIEVLHKIFSEEQIKIIVFERLTSHPEAVVKEVFEFLGVSSQNDIKFFNANKTGEARFKTVNKILFDKEKNKGLRKLAKIVVPAKARLMLTRFIKDSNTKKSIPKGNAQELSSAYKNILLEDRKKLEKYIDVEAYW